MRDTLPVEPVDPVDFRALMSRFATGVCVVSVSNNEAGDTNAISGITVNSLVSVSLEPRLVSWSLQNASSQFDLYASAKDFGISILAADQQALAQRYAARGDTALVEQDFVRTQRGIPVIADALGYLECKQWSLYEAGDHTMIFGEVVSMEIVHGGRGDESALGFFGGRFCRVEGAGGA